MCVCSKLRVDYTHIVPIHTSGDTYSVQSINLHEFL